MKIQINAPHEGVDNIKLRFSAQAVKQLDKLASHYPTKKSLIIPALWIAQREYGGSLTSEAVKEVAYRLGVADTEVDGVASFYTMFSLKPRGRNIIRLCDSPPCYLMGSTSLLDYLKTSLGIDIGTTTSDGAFTLETTSCLGACGVAPAMMLNDEMFGNLTPEKIDAILENRRKEL